MTRIKNNYNKTWEGKYAKVFTTLEELSNNSHFINVRFYKK
jgi:hypothetical protein